MSDESALVGRLAENMRSVVLGKPEVVRHCLIALLCGEHLLLEDVPGVGKTLVGKALARSLAGLFARVQFTPDLLPSDILGTSIFNTKLQEFEFHAGPIFANIVLADEINRTPPRTQSALLEAMSEGQVSIDGETRRLPRPFTVIATQNPYEFEGTYPLPESQLDRFLLRISMGYPERAEELRVLASHRGGEPVDQLEPAVSPEDVLAMQRGVRATHVADPIAEYVLDLVQATREHEELSVGVSTRGALCLYRASQAAAFLDARDFVTPDDVKGLAVPVLAHRVIPHGYLQGPQRGALESLIADVVARTPTPT